MCLANRRDSIARLAPHWLFPASTSGLLHCTLLFYSLASEDSVPATQYTCVVRQVTYTCTVSVLYYPVLYLLHQYYTILYHTSYPYTLTVSSIILSCTVPAVHSTVLYRTCCTFYCPVSSIILTCTVPTVHVHVLLLYHYIHVLCVPHPGCHHWVF